MNKSEMQNLIKELIEKTTISVSKISVDEDKPTSLHSNANKTTWFSVEVSQPHFFWDRGGEALFAVNHLARRIIEAKTPKETEKSNNPKDTLAQEGLGILIDINGFQKKHIENIHAIAYMMAERARYFKSNIEIDPMPAFERRIVHEFLSDVADLKTESQGEGLSRRVVIKYIGAI
ncbi:MAG: Protein jag [Candidatus Nomurabacteria bacterium GW2011_GWF2_35_12]|uniref:Protein jag n=3 Tax=Candidatus Nomuraibacteriota TaxID=1752729 RepID=A0A0G0GDP2_9BACT|nr:MAG: Protein jag [Candidatus Nomurabacteria bacterium GW2011_GWF2_35_12]KKP72792.1 MAG: Protein jag [Candidatus Nomurabacteria bacterium GW2011_GWB1_35_20]KKP75523.1 MAG: Protein jag [Parcubacteria group bacterium GW2011_GWC1_35_21]KKP78015.1 MAG: Protein jag [Candidatus Nomurabacteria bacterium GW2011_GWC2_35_35]KKP85435.1 MAG: Protein jag [Parcubacteria group bacterium GW2011_GWD2_35_7]KKP97960.1 MAG: Protein jag [Candidatus Nomurabacteria bacterium GW2011_GWA1_36_15]HCY18133.1 hypotheti